MDDNDELPNASLTVEIFPMQTEIASTRPTVEDTSKVVKPFHKDQTLLKETASINSQNVIDIQTRMNIIDQHYYESMSETSGTEVNIFEPMKGDMLEPTLQIIQETSKNVTAVSIKSTKIRKFKVTAGVKAFIVAKFYSKITKTSVMDDRKKSKLNDGLFFNEIPSNTNRSSLFEARKLKKEGNLCHEWTPCKQNSHKKDFLKAISKPSSAQQPLNVA